MVVLGALGLPALAAATSLPDGRGYEMVTPLDKNDLEVGPGIGSTNGNAVNWEAIGGCCGASSAASTLFQSSRSSSGWQTTSKTPTPPNQLEGLFQEQQPLWWSADLGTTIYTTPATYDSHVDRNPAPNGPPPPTSFLDLYEQGSTGTMSWLTQPFPSLSGSAVDTKQDDATFATATPDGNSVVFNTQEALTGDAVGNADLNTPPEYLYVRNVSKGTTTLVNVTSSTLTSAVTSGATDLPVASTSLFSVGQTITIGVGNGDQETATISDIPDQTDIDVSPGVTNNHASGETVDGIISPDGAIAGNGNWLDQGFLPADNFGTTTNSISSDGSKIFFESPPSFAGGGGGAEGVGLPNLYMRDLTNDTTTQIDANPGSPGQAIYEGASQDGSLAFFTSDEALGGDANTNNQLYEYDVATGEVIPLSNDSSAPTAACGGTPGDCFVGITAISNDGSHVWFIDKDALPGALGSSTPTLGQMNFYVYDTTSNTTTFIGQLGSGVPGDTRDKTALAGEPDTSRAAIPTPDGSALVFESSGNLTGQNASGPSTTLTADTASQTNDEPVTIPVASSAGFLVGRSVEIDTTSFIPESATIVGIPDSTHLEVTDGGIGLFFPHFSGDSVIQRPPFEVYRYDTASNTLACLSCKTETGAALTGSAGLGASGGGTYGPAGDGVPMSSTASRIFFDSPDPLTPGVVSTPPIPIGLFGGLTFVSNVYEWEADGTGSCTQSAGCLFLLSDGHSTTGSALGSTTPSGNDVFFTTEDQLVPQDTDGFDDIYDARVGGGFPAPPPPAPACTSSNSCRTSVAPTQFFSTPASSTLVSSNANAATFSVKSISAKQRKQFAKTGKLKISVSVSQAGKVNADLSAKIGGALQSIDSVSHSFFNTGGGKASITVRLNKAARKALAKKHKLSLDLSVSYSESSSVNVASLTLTKGKSKKSGKSKKTVRHGSRAR
jgi:hypothetical protein